MSKKCEICGKYLKNLRGYNIHYNRMHGEKIKNSELDVILNRIRKLELDNSFMKTQLKHKTFVGKSKDAELNWNIPKEVIEVRIECKVKFGDVVKELKGKFTEDFNYHDILKPIDPIEELIAPPVMIEVLA